MQGSLTPSGPLSVPFIGLARLVAASPRFRELCEVDNSTDALAHVFFPCVDLKADPAPTRPFVIIDDDDMADWEMDNKGSNPGSLVLSFEFEIPDEYTENLQDSDIWFRNTVGDIVLEMLRLADTTDEDGNYLWNMIAIKKFITPTRVNASNDTPGEKPIYAAAYLVSFV